MSDLLGQAALEILKHKKLNACPLCCAKRWTSSSSVHIRIESEKQARVIPAAVLTCDNCGFMSFHSTKALGLKEGE